MKKNQILKVLGIALLVLIGPVTCAFTGHNGDVERRQNGMRSEFWLPPKAVLVTEDLNFIEILKEEKGHYVDARDFRPIFGDSSMFVYIVGDQVEYLVRSPGKGANVRSKAWIDNNPSMIRTVESFKATRTTSDSAEIQWKLSGPTTFGFLVRSIVQGIVLDILIAFVLGVLLMLWCFFWPKFPSRTIQRVNDWVDNLPKGYTRDFLKGMVVV